MGIWEYDFASDRMTWSDSLIEICGLSAAQTPANAADFFELIHPDDRGAVKGAFERALRHSTDLVHEFRMHSPDGRARWIAARARVVPDASGRSAGMIGVGIDVSQLKLLEEQFRQAQKMEAIGQLAGGVAHDFNNLLTAIHGYSSLLFESLSPNDNRRADVDQIIKAAERAARLTQQLLAFSRKQILQPTLLNLNQLITDTAKMLRRLIGENIELVTRLAPDLAPVRADVGQLEQIVMNLAVNARDAMPQGGRLSIETANIVLDRSYALHHVTVRPGAYVMLAVADNGLGMDEQTKRRIFEPFFTTKEQGRGTGLGLATVYGIVKQSGGYVWAYSEQGRGATFKIYLPRAEESGVVERAVVQKREMPPTGSETVLLVEDDRAVRQFARVILVRAGYHVLEAEHARNAEEVVRQYADRIHLLVSDLIMPGLSGPALFERLSAERPGIKVLYISGYTDDAFIHQSGLPADVPFLQKPFTGDGLLRKVREVIDR
jgi:two-component system cell cycle sensor histidine kinase/response regulator CckA